MNKTYYFVSYSICGSKGIDVKNAVTDLHPFEWIAALNHTFINLPLIIKVTAAIITWREISENEYLLFQV